jgi:dolichol kinase
MGREARAEIGRNLVHLGGAMIPASYWYVSPAVMALFLMTLAGVALVLEGARRGSDPSDVWVNCWFGSMFRPDERGAWTGATWVVLAWLACVLLFPKPIAIAAMLMLSLGDAMATVVGRRFGRTHIGDKSLEGSVAMLVTASAVGLWCLPAKPFAALCGAGVATLAELFPLRWGWLRVNDNVSLPLAAGAAMWLALQGWHQEVG